jgi:hypothetical protein
MRLVKIPSNQNKNRTVLMHRPVSLSTSSRDEKELIEEMLPLGIPFLFPFATPRQVQTTQPTT